MAYEQLTLETFRKRLGDGHYTEPGHARKAIGKAAGMGQAQKDQAKKLVEQHFGGTAKPAAKAAVKSPPAVEKEKPAARQTRKAAPVIEPLPAARPGPGRGRRKVAAAAPRAAGVEEQKSGAFGIAPIQNMTVERAIELAREATTTVQMAYQAACQMAEGNHQVDLTLIRAQAMETVEKAGSILSEAAGVVQDCSRRTATSYGSKTQEERSGGTNGNGEEDPVVLDRLRRAAETVDAAFPFGEEHEGDA